MRCPFEAREFAEMLLAYCDRTMDPDTQAVFERHLGSCEACRRLATAQQAVWAALEDWREEPISEDFNRRLYRRIDFEESRGWWGGWWHSVRGVSWKPALSLAAAGVTVLAVMLLRAPTEIDRVPQRLAETVDIDEVQRSLEDLEMLQVLSLPVQKEQPGPRTM